MNWTPLKEEPVRIAHPDYTILLVDRARHHPALRPYDFRALTEGEVWEYWKSEIESGSVDRMIAIFHHKHARRRFDLLQVNTKRKRVYDPASGTDMRYDEVIEYLYGAIARAGIIDHYRDTPLVEPTKPVEPTGTSSFPSDLTTSHPPGDSPGGSLRR